ncbi:MAG: aldo/keto reductase [Acidobacteriia bacterium]|nr:aldo/keto reductase [Terriglobia bacterium]
MNRTTGTRKLLGYNRTVSPGFATPEGAARLVARFAAFRDRGFYRKVDQLDVSSVGLGTYLGNADDRTDSAYCDAVIAAVRGGINFLDTAINYRHQRSERSIGAALAELFRTGDARRDEVAVATKAGFLTPGAVPAFLKAGDVAGDMHSMEADFLADQIERSRANLGLETIDIFYLHNPETQLGFVSREEFDHRIRLAFLKLEQMAADGKIRHYGTATWDGYRKPAGAREALNLARLLELAVEAGGSAHHFRFIQLPFNLAMPEAFTNGVLELAAKSGITAVASASLLQARLARDLPQALAEKLPGLSTDAQRAIQFTRSAPGIAVALVGMSKAAHVAENLAVASVPPLAADAYLDLFQRA